MADIVGYFPATLAIDIATRTPQRNARAQVFAITDTAFTKPLAITDITGVPIANNTLEANGDGVYPEFRTPSGETQVIVKSGQALTPMTSISVYADAAVKAAATATTAAGAATSAAGSAAQAAAAATAVGATTDAQMAAVQASPTSAFAVAQKAAFAPDGTAGNISKSTAQGIALVQALIFGGN